MIITLSVVTALITTHATTHTVKMTPRLGRVRGGGHRHSVGVSCVCVTCYVMSMRSPESEVNVSNARFQIQLRIYSSLQVQHHTIDYTYSVLLLQYVITTL